MIRVLQRDPDSAGVFLDELRTARGANASFDAFVEQVARRLAELPRAEGQARRVIEMMACALQASLLLRQAPPAVSDAFCVTRLAGDWGQAFGTMPAGIDAAAIIDRARVA